MEVCLKKLSADINSNVCLLPKNIFDGLNLSTESPYTIHYGLSKKEFFLCLLNKTENNMYFSEDIFNEINLLEDATLNIWKKNNDIFIGPLVGILVTDNYLKKALKISPPYLTQHIGAGIEEHCLPYFFTTSSVDLKEKKVKAVTFIPKQNKYDFCYLPIPNVVYEKCFNFRKGERHLKGILKRKLKNDFNIKLINNVISLGKWEVSFALSKYPEIRKYLPETMLYRTFDDVIEMLNRSNFIFIKSSYGSKGKEVISIEKLATGYKLNYDDNGLKEFSLSSINHIKDIVTSFIGNKKYIIQQGIRLLTFKGRRMDLRIHSMKNEYGKWESIFKSARIAKGNLSITNYAAGGDHTIYEQIYEDLKAEHRYIEVPSSEKLEEATSILSSYIEKEFGAMGEIGLDIGIDTSGSIWILEANATPDKLLDPGIVDMYGKSMSYLIPKFYKGLNENKPIMPQAQAIFKYAKFLAGLTKNN